MLGQRGGETAGDTDIRWSKDHPADGARTPADVSSAIIADVEASIDGEAEKNALCSPVPMSDAPQDRLRMILPAGGIIGMVDVAVGYRAGIRLRDHRGSAGVPDGSGAGVFPGERCGLVLDGRTLPLFGSQVGATRVKVQPEAPIDESKNKGGRGSAVGPSQ